ncbi:MAG: SMC family ATPase [Dehalococcoidia bacterium]
MRPLQLQLQGFTAFHDRITVEFGERRLFAITGPTGAGKSSLLDGMIWALFGRVPRVSNRIGELISHGALQARVHFEFEAHGHQYRVARVRPLKGQTTARLERLLPGGDALPLADSVNEVNTHVETILGIDYDTFVKTIILPQGEFSAFLSGDPKDKKTVLSRLLGLDVYRAMMQAANNRAGGAKSAADALQQQHEQLDYRSADALTALESQLRDAEARQRQLAARQAALQQLDTVSSLYLTRAKDAAAAVAAHEQACARATAADAAVTHARSTLEAASVAVERTAEQLASLGYDRHAHQQARERLASAERLEAARAQLQLAERSLVAARATETVAAAQRARAEALRDSAEAALATAIRDLTVSASVAAACASRLEAEASTATSDSAEAGRKSHEAELRAKQLQHLAEAAHALRRDVEAADAEAQRATAAAATAEAAAQQAAAAEATATEELTRREQALDAARIADAAAAILATLSVGDPCPVCGEPLTDLREHAAPDLDAAARAVDVARKAHTRAREAAGHAGNEAAAAHARAEEARRSLTAAVARQAAHEDQLTAAAATRTGVDRAAKRAAAVAAAERERAAEHETRAAALAEDARTLRALLARLPHDIEIDAGAAPSEAGIEEIASALGSAIESHATAASGAADARATLVAAEAALSNATAEVSTALALHQHQAAAVEEAAQVLTAAGEAAATADTLREAVTALDRMAEQDAALRAALDEHERARAAASAVVVERDGAREAATRAAAEAETVAAVARETASAACVAFEAEWRRQLPPNLSPDAAAVADLIQAANRKATDLAAEAGRAAATLEAARGEVARATRLLKEAATFRRTSEVAAGLGLELQANRFVAFIQREAMQVLAADAGDRMLQLSRDRYRLEADGDEFVVVDRLNGDERRSVRTLSGGETFLASLALALALSERLPELSGHGGALALDSLFLDEGFGSLDAESLDIAIQGLELLATGSRMIGVISHVPEVAERLADRIEVVKVGGTSTIRDGR